MTKRAASGPFGTFCHNVVTKRAGVSKRAGCAPNLTRFVTLVPIANLPSCDAGPHDLYLPDATTHRIVQELCESRGGLPGLSVLTSLLVSVDVKLY